MVDTEAVGCLCQEGLQGSFVQLFQHRFSKPWLEQKSPNLVL